MAWAQNDYVEVADRIKAWYGEHPQGRIETELLEFTDDRVVVKARAYRGGEEWPAGIGHSYLHVPGSTNFTKGSELENAETSAVGRALVMAGIPAKSVASTSELAAKKGNKRSDQGAKPDAGGVSLPPAETPASTSVAHAGEGVRAAAGNREQGSGNVSGEAASGPCSHQDWSPLRPDGIALPEGFERCLACGLVRREAA